MSSAETVVAVETNWILDVALHQHQGSEELLVRAEQGHVRLVLPSFCIAESITSLEDKRKAWKNLEQTLLKAKREILRSAQLAFAEGPLEDAVQTLARVGDTVEAEFWTILERITQVVILREPNQETVTLTRDIRQLLDLSAADASVLATVVLARRAELCRMFLSQDEDFQAEPVGEYMKGQGLDYLSNPDQILGPIRGRLAQESG